MKGKEAYLKRVTQFMCGKQLEWTKEWVMRGYELNETNAVCQACGSRAVTTMAVMKDKVTGQEYWVGSNCFSLIIRQNNESIKEEKS